jgi:hypothetical protein
VTLRAQRPGLLFRKGNAAIDKKFPKWVQFAVECRLRSAEFAVHISRHILCGNGFDMLLAPLAFR